MTLLGGLRDRMIVESVLRFVEAELTTKGWFDSGRQHAPITMIDAFPEEDAEVPLNTLAVSVGDSFQEMLELGSKGEVHQAPIFFDFFAESDALGRHVAGDIYQVLNENPVIPIFDYSLATPTEEFMVEVVEETVEKQTPPRATNPWQKHWQTVVCILRDDRANG